MRTTEHAQKHKIGVRSIIDVRIATRVTFDSDPDLTKVILNTHAACMTPVRVSIYPRDQGLTGGS